MPISEGHTPPCSFNRFVDCPLEGRVCSRCGWNPKVNLDRFIRKFGYEQADELLSLSIKAKNAYTKRKKHEDI